MIPVNMTPAQTARYAKLVRSMLDGSRKLHTGRVTLDAGSIVVTNLGDGVLLVRGPSSSSPFNQDASLTAAQSEALLAFLEVTA